MNRKTKSAFWVNITLTIYKIITTGRLACMLRKESSNWGINLQLVLTILLSNGCKIFSLLELNDHIFKSGQGNTSFTINNLEFAAGISFYLKVFFKKSYHQQRGRIYFVVSKKQSQHWVFRENIFDAILGCFLKEPGWEVEF